MSIASLNRMTVPLASSQSASVQGLLMPKLKYRFRVVFEKFGVSSPKTELTKQIVSFARPSVRFEEMTIPIYNSQIYLAGKHSWETTQVEVRDDALNNVSKLVGEQLQKQLDFMEMASARSGIDYKFVTRCEMLDGGNGASAPAILETWELYGCYLSQVNYNDVNYGTNEPVNITLTLKFDNAIQTPIGEGIGSQVGRTIGDLATG